MEIQYSNERRLTETLQVSTSRLVLHGLSSLGQGGDQEALQIQRCIIDYLDGAQY